MLPTDFMQMFYLKRQNSPLLLVHYHKWMLSFIKCSCLMFLSFLILFFLIQNVFIGMVSHSSWYRILLVLLPSERSSFCKPCFSSCRLAQDNRAANTQNYCLCMAKDGGDFIASWAFYIHEIGIGALHQALLVSSSPLLERDEEDPLWEACSREEVVTAGKGFYKYFKEIFGLIENKI